MREPNRLMKQEVDHGDFLSTNGCLIRQLDPYLLDSWPVSDECNMQWYLYQPINIAGDGASCLEPGAWNIGPRGATIGSGTTSDIRVAGSTNVLPVHARLYNSHGVYYVQNHKSAAQALLLMRPYGDQSSKFSSARLRSTKRASVVTPDVAAQPSSGTFINICADSIRPEYEVQKGDEFYVNGHHFTILSIESHHDHPRESEYSYFRRPVADNSDGNREWEEAEIPPVLLPQPKKYTNDCDMKSALKDPAKERTKKASAKSVTFSAVHTTLRFRNSTSRFTKRITERSQSTSNSEISNRVTTTQGNCGIEFDEETRYTPSVPIPPNSTRFKVTVQDNNTGEIYTKTLGHDHEDFSTLTIGTAERCDVKLEPIQKQHPLLKELPSVLKSAVLGEVYAQLDCWDGRLWLSDIGSSQLYFAAVAMGHGTLQNLETLERGVYPWEVGTHLKVLRDSPVGPGDVIFVSGVPMQLGTIECDGSLQSLALEVRKAPCQISEDFLFQKREAGQGAVMCSGQSLRCKSQNPFQLDRSTLEHEGQLREKVYLGLSNRMTTEIGKFLHGPRHGSSMLRCDDSKMSVVNAAIQPANHGHMLCNLRSGANHQLLLLQGRREVRGIPIKLNQGDIFHIGRNRFKILNMKVDDGTSMSTTIEGLLRERARRASYAAVKIKTVAENDEAMLEESEPLMCVPVVIKKEEEMAVEEQQLEEVDLYDDDEQKVEGSDVESDTASHPPLVSEVGSAVSEGGNDPPLHLSQRTPSWTSFRSKRASIDSTSSVDRKSVKSTDSMKSRGSTRKRFSMTGNLFASLPGSGSQSKPNHQDANDLVPGEARGPTLECAKEVPLTQKRHSGSHSSQGSDRTRSRRSSAAMVVVPQNHLEVREMIKDVENEEENMDLVKTTPQEAQTPRRAPRNPSESARRRSMIGEMTKNLSMKLHSSMKRKHDTELAALDQSEEKLEEAEEVTSKKDDKEEKDSDEVDSDGCEWQESIDEEDEDEEEYTNNWDSERAALYRIAITKDMFRVKGDVIAEEELDAASHYITLQAIRGPGKNRVARFTTSRISIGNRDDNSITINDRSLSAHHCMILYSHGSYYLFDRSSQTGTYYVPQSDTTLAPGTNFRLADTEFTVYGKYKSESCCNGSAACSLQ